jgi:hypothetical protein
MVKKGQLSRKKLWQAKVAHASRMYGRVDLYSSTPPVSALQNSSKLQYVTSRCMQDRGPHVSTAAKSTGDQPSQLMQNPTSR